MTSDTFPKEVAIAVETPKGTFRVGGIAKGAGMIDPNMATMLCVLTTDAAIPQPAFRKVLKTVVANSFNRITVDGDMSTNDTVIALANGASEVTPDAETLAAALEYVSVALAKMIVKDGEEFPSSSRSKSAARPPQRMPASPPRLSPTPLSLNAPGRAATRTGAASWTPWVTPARR